ncbi:hypothetical protein BN159_2423 [Streptomyces davaonensis JCM 4913]|uniref:SnoaL-like domain-containing protein n=1 Tax=Streptomyces davaonensis (strain DSM 101723 / JCM 4913 / KCC S-0913 / 768) TaxID=1214101 RepID=K4R108_STRDJ|nr:hypothetical protein [Streptomyces davaonensis]CCK26802.1 hypothetical protein BN159_2423 [Streptomyces davaonensis JCM 4913]
MTVIDIDPHDLARDYVAQWNAKDAAERRAAIERLWSEDGTHILQPPLEIREIAAGLGFDHPTLRAQGYDAIETRVTRSYEEFVAQKGYAFRLSGDAVRLDRLVKFAWDTVLAETGEVLGGGLEILELDDDGRIRTDYMFPGA